MKTDTAEHVRRYFKNAHPDLVELNVLMSVELTDSAELGDGGTDEVQAPSDENASTVA